MSAPGEAPEEADYHHTPVFIRAEGKKEYVYFGDYSQLRYADKLDHERVMDTVPEKVRQYWADQLAAEGRPEWVTESLMEHFWPKPTYSGPIPTDSALNTPATEATVKTDSSAVLEKRVTRALNAYAVLLKDWEKQARVKVALLSARNVMQAFAKSEQGGEQGLRLWWEYLECVGV